MAPWVRGAGGPGSELVPPRQSEARTGTRVEIRELTGEHVGFERRYPPGTGRADAHLHLDFTQRWEVASGTVTAVVDGEARRLGPSESVGTGSCESDANADGST